MGADSKIEWTDATWNPTRGCTKVGPGCKHCYAETFAERWRGIPGHAYEQGFDPRFVPDQLDKPLHWKKPRRIFVNSMSDLFHEAFSNEQIAEVFGVMAVASGKFQRPADGFKKLAGGLRMPNALSGPHTFQILTKRAERMRNVSTSSRFRDLVASAAHRYAIDRRDAGWLSQCVSGRREWGNHCTLDKLWPLPNVWLGVSIESRKYALRIDALREATAAVRFLSCEPLLEDLGALDLSGIDWVIAGAESGRGARPMQEDWIRSLRDQCATAGVRFFYKQRVEGGRKVSLPLLDGAQHAEFPEARR